MDSKLFVVGKATGTGAGSSTGAGSNTNKSAEISGLIDRIQGHTRYNPQVQNDLVDMTLGGWPGITDQGLSDLKAGSKEDLKTFILASYGNGPEHGDESRMVGWKNDLMGRLNDILGWIESG